MIGSAALSLAHRAGRRAALEALAGVFDGALVGALAGAAEALDADGQALVVHHGEHRRQALLTSPTSQPVAPSKFITQVAGP